MTTEPHIVADLRDTPASELDRLIRRVTMQLEFARALVAVAPELTESAAAQVAKAEQTLAQCDTSSGIEGLAKLVSAIEADLIEVGKVAKTYRIHCVGHGHIDMNWMWNWPETVATTHDTFASVLSLMRKYPDLTYSQSQASVYAIMERHHPDLFEEIRQRVREGRWEVTASQWVEGDKNLASGESLCRHLLYTRQYLADRFGLSPEDQPIDWEPDTFGHAATIPAFLSRGAVKYYYSCRTGGGNDTARIGEQRPPLFYWRAPDGSQVLVNRETTWYNSYVNIGENIALSLINFTSQTGRREWLNVYGLGNHGGGPTQSEIRYLHELQDWPIYPTIEFSTTKRYFNAIEAESAASDKPIPVINHELNFEFTGCYTSQSIIKQANRFGENYLLEAETLSTLVNRLFNTPYPKERLQEAWLKVLFSQFHDILPGSGVRGTREYASAGFQEVSAITGSIKRNMLKLLVDRVDTAALLPNTWSGNTEREEAGNPTFGSDFEGGAGLMAGQTGMSATGSYGNRFRPYVVFNPSPWERSETVTARAYDYGYDSASTLVILPDGSVQAPLHFSGDSGDTWGHDCQVFTFVADNVPALGYKTFMLCEASSLPLSQQSAINKQSIVVGANERLETKHLALQIDAELSGVRELVDRLSGAIILPAKFNTPLGGFEYVVERGTRANAWVLGREFEPPIPLRAKAFELVGCVGDVNSSDQSRVAPAGFVANAHLGVPGTTSTARLRIAISDRSPRIDFTAEVDWREIGDELRGIPGLAVSIPLGFSSITATYETPFGSIARDLNAGEEVPSLRYAHIEGIARTADGKEVFAGLTLVQDCKYGHSITGNAEDGYVLRLRILRSSFAPDQAPEVAITTVRYAIILHDQPCDAAELARLAAEINHSLIVAPAGVHAGSLPPSRGFARVVTPGVVLTALKKAENGNGLIVRLSEPNGKGANAIVELDQEFAAGLSIATPLDLLERPIGAAIPIVNGKIAAPIEPYGFVTLLVQ